MSVCVCVFVCFFSFNIHKFFFHYALFLFFLGSFLYAQILFTSYPSKPKVCNTLIEIRRYKNIWIGFKRPNQNTTPPGSVHLQHYHRSPSTPLLFKTLSLSSGDAGPRRESYGERTRHEQLD